LRRAAEAEAVRERYRTADDAVRDLEQQIEGLEKQVNADYGPGHRFATLAKECVEFKPGGEFSYELCPYKDANQKNSQGTPTLVGTWEGFGEGGDYKTMKFGGGAYCWNAGARTLTVSLICAKENRILGVEEPEVCKYSMRLETPAACYDDDAAAAKADLEALSAPAHDEL
jgi:protein kinase C substrate 80K-H